MTLMKMYFCLKTCYISFSLIDIVSWYKGHKLDIAKFNKMKRMEMEKTAIFEYNTNTNHERIYKEEIERTRKVKYFGNSPEKIKRSIISNHRQKKYI